MIDILCDIDNTIANSFWREPLIEQGWDIFHSASDKDQPLVKMTTLINHLYDIGYTIVVVTGRPEKYRKMTLDWLIRNCIPSDTLLMRPNDDFSSSAEMKVKIVKEHFNNNFSSIQMLIDDSEEICLAFNKLGITTLQIRAVQ